MTAAGRVATPGPAHRPGESIENITVNGQGGNDDLSAKGGNGTGAPAGQVCLDTDPVTRRHPRSWTTTSRRTSRSTVAPVTTSCRAASAATC